MLEDKLKNLPDTPGVYIMKNAAGEIIYVGKAVVLKNRVRQYFQKSGSHSSKVLAMVAKVADLETITTATEDDALILENALIKQHQPMYNILLKDDKTYPYLKVTLDEALPRVLLTRRIEADGARYFGPYTHSSRRYELLRDVRRFFRLRTCNQLPKRACIERDIGGCAAPCVGDISGEDYRQLALKACAFLARHTDTAPLQPDPSAAVGELQQQLSLANPPRRMECFDISHVQGAETVASLVSFVDGRPNKAGYRRYKLRGTEGKPDDFASMQEVVERRYSKLAGDELPDLIIIDGGKGQLSSALEIIRRYNDVPVIALAKQHELVFTERSHEPTFIARNSAALYLLQRIRDEAHRFAITYHRLLRRKRNMASELDTVPGVGAKRRQALWKRFGTLDKIKAADPAALAAVPAMTRASAEAVYRHFHGNHNDSDSGANE